MLDGANIFRVYRWVPFPLSMPAFAVVMGWQFTSIWNEFLFALVITQNPAICLVMVALYNLARGYIVRWDVQIVGGTPGSNAHPAGLHLPGPLLHAGTPGRCIEGINQVTVACR